MKTKLRQKTCRTHQEVQQHLQKNSIRLLRILIKVNPIVINIWIMLVSVGFVFGYDVTLLNKMRFDLGNSTIHCLVYLTGSYAFRLCKWHKLLIISMLIHPILLRLQDLNVLVNCNIYISIIVTTLSLIYAALSSYYGFCRKRKTKKDVQVIH